MDRPLRLLCIDHEGGHGGSSRSLFEVVRHLDPERFHVEVWSRRRSHLTDEYAALGIRTEIHPEIVSYNARRGTLNNVIALVRALARLVRAAQFRRRLADAGSRADVVHFNHEGLFLLAWWFRRVCVTPMTGHVRTQPTRSVFARFEAARLCRVFDHLIFITENEQANLERILGGPCPGSVVHNIATPSDAEPWPDLPKAPLWVASLSNYSWWRGTDRLIEIAQVLAARGRRDIRFLVAGDQQVSGPVQGPLADVAARKGGLAEYAAAMGVADMFVFLGHIAEPERVLTQCDVLVKPTREANPWGRDIIEALANGLPVLSVGTWGRFVEDGVTGYLQKSFSACETAERLLTLADEPGLLARLSGAAAGRAASLFSPSVSAPRLAAIWQRTAGPVSGSGAAS